jgi:hypothetical protein
MTLRWESSRKRKVVAAALPEEHFGRHGEIEPASLGNEIVPDKS